MRRNSLPPRFKSPVDLEQPGALLTAYRRDGFAIIEDFFKERACRDLIERADHLVSNADLSALATVFSTTSLRHATDEYFATSGDKIRFFLEEGAFDAGGQLIYPRQRAINKIGHALHDLDETFDRFSRDSHVAKLVGALGLRQPLLLQSMYIFKQANIGGEVVCHTDATYLFTEPLSVVGLWIALEDATIDNGCLWALPGCHTGPLKSRFRRGPAGLSTEVYDATPWPMSRRTPLEVARGTLILLNGLCPHMSDINRSPRSRQAYTLHVIDGACDYPADNWLQRGPEMPLRGF
ncbi:MAG: phytanoyl-CoA dioxygenase family protein [Dongiaceae bacterium]